MCIYDKNPNANFLCSPNIQKVYQNIYKIYTKHISQYIQIYPKCIQDIQDTQDMQDIQDRYKIPSGNRPKPKGRARAGPEPARPWAWAGPAAAWYFVSILYILHILYILDVHWICLEILWVYCCYIFGIICLVSVWYIFDSSICIHEKNKITQQML